MVHTWTLGTWNVWCWYKVGPLLNINGVVFKPLSRVTTPVTQLFSGHHSITRPQKNLWIRGGEFWVDFWWCFFFGKNFPTYPWNIPQTPKQRFLKEFRFHQIWGICLSFSEQCSNENNNHANPHEKLQVSLFYFDARVLHTKSQV